MTNAKSTKRALVSSALAILMCVAMLIGTTFAWFTDTASTGVNKITSGNLHVEIQDEAGEPIANLEWVAKDGRPQDEILWEPGATYTLTPFKIVNTGNLALKYKLVVTGLDGDADLLKVIKFTYNLGDTALDLDAEGHLAANGKDGFETGLITVSAHMDETAGNEYMDMTLDGVKITVYATQDTVENDSFGNTYDENATYMMYPAGVTEASFDEAASVKVSTRDYATGEFITKEDTTKPAVAAYVDSKGETQYAADIKAAVLDGATVIYCKKDANMRVDFDGIRTEALTNDLTIYANGADFNYGEIALNASTPGANTDSGDLNIKVYNAKNIKIWGNTPADGVTWNIEMVNCHNVGNGPTGNNGEMILLWGDTGTVNATITNCSVAKADLGIYFGCNGSLTVKDSEFTECATGIKTSYKGTGTRTDRIENCVFTNCGCTEEMAGTGSTAYLAEDSAAYKYKNSNTGTLTLTTKGNTITGTIGNKGDTQIADTVTLIEE